MLVRWRPAILPPMPMALSATKTRKRPDTTTSTIEVSRQVGEVDTTERPIAEPKAKRTEETAAATMAPAMMGPHGMVVAGATATVSVRPPSTTTVSMAASVQADEGQSRHDDDDESDQINDAVHNALLRVVVALSNGCGCGRFRSVCGYARLTHFRAAAIDARLVADEVGVGAAHVRQVFVFRRAEDLVDLLLDLRFGFAGDARHSVPPEKRSQKERWNLRSVHAAGLAGPEGFAQLAAQDLAGRVAREGCD